MAHGVPRFSRVSGFGPLAAMIARERGDASMFHHRGLDLASFGAATPIPFALMNTIFERAARLAGDDLFGARVGLGMAPEDFGPFIDYALAGETVGAMISRQTAVSSIQSNALHWELGVAGGEAIWSLKYPADAGLPLIQHAMHFLPTMIDGLRRYVGDDAALAEVRVPALTRTSARRLEDLLGVRARADREVAAVAFPAAWLGRWRPVAGAPGVGAAEGAPADLDRPLPRTMVEAILADLTLRADAEGQDLGAIAADLGSSRRTVQRLLSAEGVSYRDLLRHARMERARGLLHHTHQPIAEIALRSGYSEQANFHRAFVAATGMTPKRFRQIARAWPLAA
jgi:AraC-like DNA-binding protein